LPDEFVIITGVVDLAVVSPDEIWFVDFKTDDADPDEWLRKARLYQPQMELYAMALNRIYGCPVTRGWLHSLPLRQSTASTW
jgi:ATP-dependent exoDNAse (exonuclease V) beta subunit